jgi:hypothetical protein
MANLDELYLRDKAHYKDYQATPSGDLATDSGQTNLQNALFRRLITSPGAIIHRPNYGVGVKDFQNKAATLPNQRELARRINEQFLQDARVKSVDSVQMVPNLERPEMTTVTVKLTPVGQDQVTMVFTPFNKA